MNWTYAETIDLEFAEYTYFVHDGLLKKYSVIQKDGLNFIRLYFLNYTWYVNVKFYVDHSHTMYSSGNIDVRNWVHLFESRCISQEPLLLHLYYVSMVLRTWTFWDVTVCCWVFGSRKFDAL
jgi:hypothetical protein